MIFIVLPVHNRINITKKFIACLVNQTYQDFKLILVDDGSTDNTNKMVLEALPKSIVLHGDGNLWWAGSLQKAFNWLKSNDVDQNNIVLLINDDTEFGDDFLETSLNLLEGKSMTLLKAWSIDKYTQLRSDGYIKADINKMRFTQTNFQSEANCASTRGLFLKIKDWYDIGGFHPKILPHYWSDYEFTIRAINRNYTLLCDDKLFLYSDSLQTGYHKLVYKNLNGFFKRYFSIKNVSHPIYRLNFIYLSSDCIKTKLLYSVKTISVILVQFLKAVVISSIKFKNNSDINKSGYFDNYIFNFVLKKYKTLKKKKSKFQLKRLIRNSNKLKLVVGSSSIFDVGWIPTDVHNLNLLNSDDWNKYFKPNTIDAILAEHVWEHLTVEDSASALANCYNYLKEGSYFRIAVPDGNHPDESYIDHVKVGGTGFGSDDHKVLYTYLTLRDSLENAGFECHLLEYFDEDGIFHFNDWNTEDGTIHRSKRYDSRNKSGKLVYTSIIIDAYKKQSL